MDDHMVVTRTVGGFNTTYGLRWKNWHYLINICDNHDKLFSLTAHPYRDIGASHPALKAILKARFIEWYVRFRNGSEDPAEIPLKNLPAGEIEELKSLGYL